MEVNTHRMRESLDTRRAGLALGIAVTIAGLVVPRWLAAHPVAAVILVVAGGLVALKITPRIRRRSARRNDVEPVVDQTSPEFDWNAWLHSVLDCAGLPEHAFVCRDEDGWEVERGPVTYSEHETRRDVWYHVEDQLAMRIKLPDPTKLTRDHVIGSWKLIGQSIGNGLRHIRITEDKHDMSCVLLYAAFTPRTKVADPSAPTPAVELHGAGGDICADVGSGEAPIAPAYVPLRAVASIGVGDTAPDGWGDDTTEDEPIAEVPDEADPWGPPAGLGEVLPPPLRLVETGEWGEPLPWEDRPHNAAPGTRGGDLWDLLNDTPGWHSLPWLADQAGLNQDHARRTLKGWREAGHALRRGREWRSANGQVAIIHDHADAG